MRTSYKNLAIDAISKCIGYDPYLPQTEAMVCAWAESLESAGIDSLEDVLMAVRVMYRVHGDPGWRPTPKVLVQTARECRKLRLERETAADAKQAELQEPERITLQEFQKRHPDMQFPAFGKTIPRE
jgi:hypothetical protein